MPPEKSQNPASTAIVSLGSNIEPRRTFLRWALADLSSLPGTRFVRASPIRETEPEGVPAAFASLRFLNRIVVFKTTLSPREFSDAMHKIEDRYGRVRLMRNGPRTIDIDLIDFDGLQLSEPGLILPHPRAHKRDFVLRPLAELGIELPFMRRNSENGDKKEQ